MSCPWHISIPSLFVYLLADTGVEYIPPSHNLLPVLGKQATVVVDGPGSPADENFEVRQQIYFSIDLSYINVSCRTHVGLYVSLNRARLCLAIT